MKKEKVDEQSLYDREGNPTGGEAWAERFRERRAGYDLPLSMRPTNRGGANKVRGLVEEYSNRRGGNLSKVARKAMMAFLEKTNK